MPMIRLVLISANAYHITYHKHATNSLELAGRSSTYLRTPQKNARHYHIIMK